MNSNYFNKDFGNATKACYSEYYANNNNSYITYQQNPNTHIYNDPQMKNITLRKLKNPNSTTFNDNFTNRITNTPESKPKKEYDGTINSKIKKTKKRDCTPLSPEKTTETYSFFNNGNIYLSNYNNNVHNAMHHDSTMSLNNNFSHNTFTRESLQQNHYGNLSKIGNIGGLTHISNIKPTSSQNQLFNQSFSLNLINQSQNELNNNNDPYLTVNNNNSYSTFTQQKSKFLKDLENENEIQLDSEGEIRVKQYLKGSLILEKLENQNQFFVEKISNSFFENNEIKDTITYEIVTSFFNGYNNRSNAFFKYFVSYYFNFNFLGQKYAIRNNRQSLQFFPRKFRTANKEYNSF